MASAPSPAASRSRRRVNWNNLAFSLGLPLLALLFALAVCAVILLLLGVNPFEAYAAMIAGAFGTLSGITQSIAKATPLLLVGLGICIAFRASVINIGAEGQIMLGAFAATWFSLAFRSILPDALLVVGTLLAGFLAGGFWGFIPGILKARFGVNEIISTVMLNVVATQILLAMLKGPLMDTTCVTAGTFLPQSEQLPEAVWLAKFVPQTLLHTGAIFAVVLAFVVYIFLWRTTIGYRIRAVGLNPDASRYAGIRVPVYQALALTLAGGLAGLAGVVEVIGVQHRLLEGITSGYGFSGIVAALFGSLHPLGTIPASYLFGSLLVGADKMQRAMQVPSSLVDVLLGLVVLFVVGSQYYARRRAAMRAAQPSAVAAATPAEEAASA